MAKAYNPSAAENSWYAVWENSNFFIADASSSKPPFVIVLPPPNVTGALHIGKALTAAIQDTINRWHRTSRFNALWVPGIMLEFQNRWWWRRSSSEKGIRQDMTSLVRSL